MQFQLELVLFLRSVRNSINMRFRHLVRMSQRAFIYTVIILQSISKTSWFMNNTDFFIWNLSSENSLQDDGQKSVLGYCGQSSKWNKFRFLFENRPFSVFFWKHILCSHVRLLSNVYSRVPIQQGCVPFNKLDISIVLVR